METELKQLISDCENYISQNGINENVINAYCEVCQLAYGKKRIDTMLMCTNRAKKLIESFCMNKIGKSMWDIEKFIFKMVALFTCLINIIVYYC